jgi:hypothetical protein
MRTPRHFIETPLRYWASMAARPYVYTYTPTPSVAQTNHCVVP